MAEINRDDDFDIYREKYIFCYENKIFPWEAAYYYYLSTVERIDIFDFEQFKDDILEKNSLCESEADAWDKFSGPMYESLDEFYKPNLLLTATGEFIKIC